MAQKTLFCSVASILFVFFSGIKFPLFLFLYPRLCLRVKNINIIACWEAERRFMFSYRPQSAVGFTGHGSPAIIRFIFFIAYFFA